ARLGDSARDAASFQRTLARVLKIASHETGHMFGMEHCTAHACNMNGSNSLPETDRAPRAPCPVCLAKICWLAGITPGEWSQGMKEFADAHPLGEEDARLRAALALIAEP